MMYIGFGSLGLIVLRMVLAIATEVKNSNNS